MHGNTLSHVPKLSCELFERKTFTGEKKMEQPPSKPDLNPNENLWPTLKMKLYEANTQYKSKADLGGTIKTTMTEIEFANMNFVGFSSR